MKIHVRLKEFDSCDFRFEPKLDVRNYPQIIISNVSKTTAFNIDLMIGNHHAHCFYNIPMNEGLNAAPLNWNAKKHYIHLVPACSGVHFFIHSWEELSFDFEVEGVSVVPVESARGTLGKIELSKVVQPKNKWGRTSAIRDEGY